MAKKATILPDLFWDSVCLTSKDSGVYGIVNRADGRIYIGGSQNLSARRGVHKFDFRHLKHAVRILQREIWSSPSNFEFVIIEQVPDSSKILEREQFWLDFYRSYLPENGYNRCRKADSILGFKHGPDMLHKFGSGLRGKKRPAFSAEWCNKISAGLKGRRATFFHKPVIQMDKLGNELRRFDCISDAALEVAGKLASGGLVRALKSGNPNTTAYGYKWKYA